MIEYLERIGAGFAHEQWLVRANGTLALAQVYDASDPAWERQVEQGTRPWLGFEHPRVVPVIDAARTPERLVIVHGDERGPSLLQVAAQLPEAERAAWACEEIASIAEAVAAMAERQVGFVHRRAQNDQLVVGADGRTRLRAPIAYVAWGVTGGYVGRGNAFTRSVWLMAPEQLRGHDVTPATDVHTLAATLYTALTGRRPFDGDTEMGALDALLRGAPPAPPTQAGAAVGELVVAGLARDPAMRPAAPAMFAAELRSRASAGVAAVTYARVAASWQPRRPAPGESHAIIGERCARSWDSLEPTATAGIRHCGQCRQDVVQVRSLDAVIPLLGKRCLSYVPDGN